MYKLTTNPWKHQWQALDYTMTHKCAAIFTDMGSGKTKIMIDTIVNYDFGLVLIVGTKKSCDVWESEFRVHSRFDKNCVFNLCKLSSSDKTLKVKEKLNLMRKNGTNKLILICNYESVWREPFKQLLLKTKIDCIICDESHKLKTPSSKASMFLARLGKKVEYRYILSGTPTPEAPTDIYGQYRFLDPDIFGTNFANFRNYYENIDQMKTAYCGFPVLDKKNPYKNLDDLKEKMYSCAFYAHADIKLPEVTHVYQECELSPEAQDIYREINKEGVYEDNIGVLETNNTLAKQTRLQQLLSGYLHLETDDFTSTDLVDKDDTKLQALAELIADLPKEEKIVVFAKYKKDFERIKALCREQDRRYGEISGSHDDYASWKAGKIDLIAVQYSSGAESISLVEARYCVYYSHTFSYGQYKQSLKRTHRPGQKRPVTYFHIISTVPKLESVDQKIKQALSMKKSLSEYLLDES